MNCDEAFDALTDSARRQCDELRRHLSLCPRCRQMQQTLEPALDLFEPPAEHESERPIFEPSLEVFETSASKGRKPFLSPEAVQLAERTAREMTASEARGSVRRYSAVLIRYAAALLVGAIVAAGIVGLRLNAGGRLTAVIGATTFEQCTWQHREDARLADGRASREVVLSCVACHLQ